MGNLYLVRHGQASFGADDYDQLSDLGHRQSVRLGTYWRQRGMRFDAVLIGTLKRHRQTWEGIAEGLGIAPGEATRDVTELATRREDGAEGASPPVLAWPGLNEYDGEAVVAAIHPDKLPKPDTPELYREHFRLLRRALSAWMAAETEPAGMPSYIDFLAGVTSALDHVRGHHHGAKVLVVSSGGPISTAVGQVLQTPADVTIELNLRMRNTSVTEFAFTPKRHMLVTYNTLPHLDGAQFEGWVTHA